MPITETAADPCRRRLLRTWGDRHAGPRRAEPSVRAHRVVAPAAGDQPVKIECDRFEAASAAPSAGYG
ncbi:hypothetical protein ACTMU2_36860 [Cupriavidus basilensis]